MEALPHLYLYLYLAAPIYCVNPSSHTLLFRMPISFPVLMYTCLTSTLHVFWSCPCMFVVESEMCSQATHKKLMNANVNDACSRTAG